MKRLQMKKMQMKKIQISKIQINKLPISKLQSQKYIILALALTVVLMCACSARVGDSVPVAGDEIPDTTGVAAPTVESTTEDASDATQDTATVDTDSQQIATEKTTEPPTASKPNYIYDQPLDDTNHIQTMGDVEISKEEFTALTELLAACDYRVSFKAVSIDGSRCISYNSMEEYFPASAIKAPYLLYCYKQIDSGNGALDEEMIYTSKYFREGTGEIKDSEEGTVYTLSEVMRRTIWNSDNSGYYMCADRWGKEGYNQLMEQIGADRLKFPSYSIWAHDTRVGDFIIAWKSIYDYFQTGTEGAKAFYDSTTNCKWNFFGGGIKDCVIAQKYGWADEAFSNAGIIYGKNETYLLAIFTDSEGDEADKKQYASLASMLHNIMNR